MITVKDVPMDTAVLAWAYHPIPEVTLPGKYMPLAPEAVGVTVGVHAVEVPEA
jgi:hypothetical protein